MTGWQMLFVALLVLAQVAVIAVAVLYAEAIRFYFRPGGYWRDQKPVEDAAPNLFTQQEIDRMIDIQLHGNFRKVTMFEPYCLYHDSGVPCEKCRQEAGR